MKRLLALLTLAAFTLRAEPPPPVGKAVPMFDGKTLAGWEGDPKLWRVEDGCLTGGSLTEQVTHNDFLATTKDYGNFIVRLKIKLTGTEGFINSGFQIRSQRVPNNSEMAGYQCDFGEPNWYGAIYDESRRNKLMAESDMKALDPVIKRQDCIVSPFTRKVPLLNSICVRLYKLFTNECRNACLEIICPFCMRTMPFSNSVGLPIP